MIVNQDFWDPKFGVFVNTFFKANKFSKLFLHMHYQKMINMNPLNTLFFILLLKNLFLSYKYIFSGRGIFLESMVFIFLLVATFSHQLL